MFDKLKRRLGLHKGNEGKELALAAEILTTDVGIVQFQVEENARKLRGNSGLVSWALSPVIFVIFSPLIAVLEFVSMGTWWKDLLSCVVALPSLAALLWSLLYVASGLASSVSLLCGGESVLAAGTLSTFWTVMAAVVALYPLVELASNRLDEHDMWKKLSADPDELVKLKLTTVRKLVGEWKERECSKLAGVRDEASKLLAGTVDSHDCTGEECEVCEDLRTLKMMRDLAGNKHDQLTEMASGTVARMDAFAKAAAEVAEARKARVAAELETSKQISAAVEQQMLEEGKEARAAREAEIAANRERARVRLLGG